jgi:uncharacterized protein YjiS (DUF1127 family)
MIALAHSYVRPVSQSSISVLVATVERWLERRSQRRALLALDNALLKDVGLTSAQAWAEGSKPFWRG